MNIDKEILHRITEKDVLVMSRIALNEYELEKGRLLSFGKKRAFLDGFERCLREISKVQGSGVYIVKKGEKDE